MKPRNYIGFRFLKLIVLSLLSAFMKISMAQAAVISDDFESRNYSGSTGDTPWTSDWVETGDNGTSTTGDVRITRFTNGSNYFIAMTDGPNRIQRAADLGIYTSAELSFDYYPFSAPTNHNTRLQFFDGASWITVSTFNDTPNNFTNHTVSIADQFLNSSFELRFVTSNALPNNDYFLIDNIVIDAIEQPVIPDPIIEYRFDEPSWDGTADEIIDYSGNNITANADSSSATTTDADGAICRAASFNGNNQFITSDDLSALRDTATLSFWIKTTQVGDNSGRAWASPAVTGIEESGGRDDIFWGWLNQNGRIGVTVGNDNSTFSTIPINDGIYHHVVLIRDAANDTYRILIDGVERGNGSFSGDGVADVIGNAFSSIGRVEYTNGTATYLDALIDEFLVFDQTLTDAQAREIYNLQSNNQNLDGSLRDCSPPPPTTCFTDNFDRGSLDGDWAVTSRSGSFGLPRLVSNRLRITNNSNNVSTAATLYRLFPSANNRVVVEFDYFAYGGSGNGDGVALVFSDSEIVPQPGGYGGSLGYAQKGGTSGFAGGWMGIGLDEYGNFVSSSDGGKGTGFGRVPNSVVIRGSGAGTSGYRYITGNGRTPSDTTAPTSLTPTVSNSSGHRYRVTIDHSNGTNAWVSVERDTGSGFEDLIETFDMMAQPGQAEIPDRMYLTITGSTGGATNNHEIDNFEVCADVIESVNVIDHYELDRDVDQGLTCEAMQIASRACLDPDCTSQISGLITTEFAPATGWESSNIKTDYNSGEVFTYRQTVAGDYQFDVISSTPAIRPLSTEPVLCFVGGVQQANCNVTFVDAAYRFFTDDSAPASPVGTYDLIASQATSPFYMRALRTDPDTGVCQPLFNNSSQPSQAGTTCTNPGTCVSGANVTWSDSASGDTVLSNSGTSNVDLTFSANSTTQFGLTAPEVGIQPLTVRTELPDADGNPSGEFITGSVNLRVRPDRLEVFDVRNGTVINDGNQVLAQAGEPFTAAIRALDVNGTIVQNFAEVTGLYTINWGLSSLNTPIGGNFGVLIGSSINQSTPGQWVPDSRDADNINETLMAGVNSTGQPTGLTYNEVGRINLVAQIDDYLGSGIAVNSSTTPVVTGRFTPAYLDATEASPDTTAWGNDSAVYQGLSEGLTGLEYRLQAYSQDGTLLRNYVGQFVNFANVAVPLLPPTGTNTAGNAYSNTGAGLLSDALIWTVGGDSDFDGQITLSGDINNLLWARKTGQPSADDTLQFIEQLTLSASAFTDSDGVCVAGSAAAACQNVALDIDDRSLYYARLSLPEQVDATATDAFIPVTLQYLSSVTANEPVFTTQTAENSFGNGVFMGLTHNSPQTCTLNTCPPNGSVPNVNFQGPLGSGPTLIGGEGLWALSITTDSGLLEVSGDVPNWLTWDWNDDGSFVPDTTLLLFGDYQGRAPILFMQPGRR